MTERRGYVAKTQLTPREKIKVVYLYEVRGIPTHLLADIFEVNSARIGEALRDIRKAIGIPHNHTEFTGTDENATD